MRTILRNEEGAAMVEAVIILPVLIVVFAAIIYYAQLISAKIGSNRKARACAWEYASAGCVKKIKGCPVRSIGDEVSAIGDEVEEPNLSGDHGALATVQGLASKILGLREAVVLQPSAKVSRSVLLGGGSRSVSGRYSVLCNEKKWEALDLGKEMFCAFVSKGALGC